MPQAHISHIVSPALRMLAVYWRGKCGKRPMPSRLDIDPLEIPTLISYVMLIDVLPGTPRFRFRLIGTRIVAANGRDITGRFVDEEVYGDHVHELIPIYASSIDRNGPTYGYNRTLYADSTGIILEWVNLPLSTDGKIVDMLLVGVDDITSPALELKAPERIKVAAGSRVFSLDFD